jgi:capsular polysaccharide biosynthesis protein
MEKDTTVIDLVALSRAMWKIKYLIVGSAIVGAALGYGYAYKSVTPLYETSIDVQLPLYCDNNTIGTAKEVAQGSELTDSVDEIMGAYKKIGVLSENIKGTSLIHITFTGSNPQKVKDYADIYQEKMVKELDSFVNEKTINDMQKANLQTLNPLPLNELFSKISLSKVKVIKQAEIPKHRIDKGYTRKTVLGLILGLVISMGYGTLKYLKKILLTD